MCVVDGMTLTCGVCGHRGEDGSTYRHDCYWVFLERMEARPAGDAVDPSADSTGKPSTRVAESSSSSSTADVPAPSSKCARCGAAEALHCDMDEPGLDHPADCLLMHHEFKPKADVPAPVGETDPDSPTWRDAALHQQEAATRFNNELSAIRAALVALEQDLHRITRHVRLTGYGSDADALLKVADTLASLHGPSGRSPQGEK
jgi:hypothetical protein